MLLFFSLLSGKNIKTQNRLLRFARNDNIICLLGGGEGLVGGKAANQPLPSRIALKPLSLRAKRSNLKLLLDNSKKK